MKLDGQISNFIYMGKNLWGNIKHPLTTVQDIGQNQIIKKNELEIRLDINYHRLTSEGANQNVGRVAESKRKNRWQRKK